VICSREVRHLAIRVSEGALVSAWTTLDSADRDLLICLPSSSVSPSAAVCGTTKDVTCHCGRLLIVNKGCLLGCYCTRRCMAEQVRIPCSQ